MKVNWRRPGIRVQQGRGEDGSDYHIEWYFLEASLGEGLKGAASIVSGQYGIFKDGQRVGVYRSLTEAMAAVEQREIAAEGRALSSGGN